MKSTSVSRSEIRKERTMIDSKIGVQIGSRNFRKFGFAVAAGFMALTLLTGCESKEQKAVDQAKAQAASTGVPQQIQYIDANGDTVTTTVTAPAAGQTQQVTTAITAPAPGPKPSRTNPVITPVGGAPAPGNSSPETAMNGPTATPYDPAAPAAPAGAPAGDQPTGVPPAVNVSVPEGTSLAIRINQHISVKHSRVGDTFTGEVVDPVEVNGRVVIPKGTPVGGRIDASHRRGHFKGSSVLELRLTSMQLNGNRYALDTHDNVRTKRGKGRRSAGFIGGMTGAGMLIGGIATGGVGLAIGGAAGAGAGTLLAGTTGNRDIEIPAETIVRFRLADALYVQD
jgi:hypothetical protein